MAVPGLIYAAIFGLLKLDQVFQILIGIALFTLVLVIYIVVLRMIHWRESEKIARAMEKDKLSLVDRAKAGPIPTPEQLLGFSEEHRARIMSMFSRITQDDIREAEMRSRRWSILASVGALLAGVMAAFIPLLFR
ncbi:hypothetical protein [Arthrobacter sp. Soil764]|uniref:hypothetical protein n=1 Tax=Arthrobacter sp. Soil764 TaxID=1736403 RepID=UPI0012E3DED5|nr:hypothetical protein [Arthrobacter sp. Soil764]